MVRVNTRPDFVEKWTAEWPRNEHSKAMLQMAQMQAHTSIEIMRDALMNPDTITTSKEGLLMIIIDRGVVIATKVTRGKPPE